MMNKTTQTSSAQQLHERWENAIERASQEKSRDAELTTDMLNNAAGLNVKSGVQAGLWSVSCGGTCGSCAQTCGCPMRG